MGSKGASSRNQEQLEEARTTLNFCNLIAFCMLHALDQYSMYRTTRSYLRGRFAISKICGCLNVHPPSRKSSCVYISLHSAPFKTVFRMGKELMMQINRPLRFLVDYAYMTKLVKSGSVPATTGHVFHGTIALFKSCIPGRRSFRYQEVEKEGGSSLVE